MANWSGEGMIVVDPQNPSNLVAGSLYQAPAAANNTSAFPNVGVSGAYASFDGGRTWTAQLLPPLPQFNNTSSPECGHVHLADSVLAFGPNQTVYYVDLSYPSGSASVVCAAPPAGTGLYVTISRDGGRSWGTPIVVAGANSGASIDKPWIAVDPRTGEVYVAYTDDGNYSQIYLQRSSDNGSSWSAPLDLSNGADSMRGVELEVDPWGGVDAAWVDQSTGGIWFCRSNSSGASFTSPTLAVTGAAEFGDPYPDAFRAYMLPALGVDSQPGSPYLGRIYVSWQNGAGGVAGSPTVDLVSSSDNGTTWAATVTVDHRDLEDFQPDVSAGPGGTVYVEWYGVNATTGIYRLYGAVSTDGAATFSPAFPVSDVNSFPQYSATGGGNAWWIGDYTDTTPSPAGVWALWTDARSRLATPCSGCLWGYVYNISMVAAELTRVSVASNVPVLGNLSSDATGNASVRLNSTEKVLPARVGGQDSFDVPATVVDNGTTWYFSSWFGSVLESAPSLNLTVTGPIDLTACYATAPDRPCTAAGAPGWVDLRVRPANATVAVNGTPVTLDGNGAATVVENPGTYAIRAVAPEYAPAETNVTVASGAVASASLVLGLLPGTLRGTVFPIDSNVSLSPNGSLSENGGGVFAGTLAPGTYLLTASRAGYTTQSLFVSIAPNATTWQNLTLVLAPRGTLEGTVFPPDAVLTLNGLRTNVTPTGSFVATLLPGEYWANVSAPDYVAASYGPILILADRTARISLALLPMNGTIAGTVRPSSAAVTINGREVPQQGSFNESVAPGSYLLEASAPDRVTLDVTVNVTPNATTSVALTLPYSVGWLTGVVTPSAASLGVAGRAVPVAPDGSFNVSLPGGTFTYTVSAAGYTTQSGSVRIEVGRATSFLPALSRESSGLLSLTSPLPYLLLGGAAGAIGLAMWGVRRRRSR